ncbi:MAG: hypothetical protein ABJB16_12290 [Saprospiraceae bacterium]
MKTVLMIMLLIGGFAIQQADAQNCGLLCPPGCCLSSCSKSAKGSAADVKNAQPIEASFASFLVAAKETLSENGMANEMKSCQPLCQPACQQTCQAKAVPTSLCQTSTGVGMFPAMETPKRVKEKS